jgi:NADH dehydrogenase FAD-containing subunit
VPHQSQKLTLIYLTRVASVTPTHVLYTVQNAEGKTEQHSIPTNFVLWSTGIAMNPFTARLTTLLPNQVHKKAVVVDSHLRVAGAPKGEVYAIGDCATVSDIVFIPFNSDIQYNVAVGHFPLEPLPRPRRRIR